MPSPSRAGQGPRAVRVNAAFLREIITARQQLEHNWHWNLPNYILKYYCSVPKMVLCVSPSSTHSPPCLSLVPLFIEVAKCEFDNFCNATDWGHLALEIAFKLFCQLRQCGGGFGSERSGDLETHWLGQPGAGFGYLRAICGHAAPGN